MAYAGHGDGGSGADYPNLLATLDWIVGRNQEIWFAFPCNIHMGPRGGAIRRVAVHIRNARLFSHRVADCGSLGHRNGSVSNRTRPAVDSATTRVLDRNAGGDSKCDPRALGHFRDDSMVA